jgi:hypothetical protein
VIGKSGARHDANVLGTDERPTAADVLRTMSVV